MGLICVLMLSCFAVLAGCGEKQTNDPDSSGTVATVESALSQTYTITFDVQGGSAVENIVSEAGKPVFEPVPTLSGKEFAGWYTSGDGGTTLSERFVFSYMPAQNITLYAKWETPTVMGKTYRLSRVETVWASDEEKALILADWDMTEEEYEAQIKSLLEYHYAENPPTFRFSADDRTVTIFNFYGDDPPDIYYYRIDEHGVLHFYDSLSDLQDQTYENKIDAFSDEFAVSADCKTIVEKETFTKYESYRNLIFELVES